MTATIAADGSGVVLMEVVEVQATVLTVVTDVEANALRLPRKVETLLL